MKLRKGRWTDQDVNTLKKLFPHNSTEDVARALWRPVENVKKKANRMGLHKSDKYMRMLGRK